MMTGSTQERSLHHRHGWTRKLEAFYISLIDDRSTHQAWVTEITAQNIQVHTEVGSNVNRLNAVSERLSFHNRTQSVSQNRDFSTASDG